MIKVYPHENKNLKDIHIPEHNSEWNKLKMKMYKNRLHRNKLKRGIKNDSTR